jgi:hypothetical protein
VRLAPPCVQREVARSPYEFSAGQIDGIGFPKKNQRGCLPLPADAVSRRDASSGRAWARDSMQILVLVMDAAAGRPSGRRPFITTGGMGASAPIMTSNDFNKEKEKILKFFKKFGKEPENFFQKISSKHFQQKFPKTFFKNPQSNLPHPLKIYTLIIISKITSIQEMLQIDEKILHQVAT